MSGFYMQNLSLIRELLRHYSVGNRTLLQRVKKFVSILLKANKALQKKGSFSGAHICSLGDQD